jgi:hypothetical protein
MATLIGLCIRVKLLRALPPRFKARAAAAGRRALLHGMHRLPAWPSSAAAAAQRCRSGVLSRVSAAAPTNPASSACLRCPQTDILLTPGSHASEAAVNKQLSDKERVAAALENPNLLQMVERCLGSSL